MCLFKIGVTVGEAENPRKNVPIGVFVDMFI